MKKIIKIFLICLMIISAFAFPKDIYAMEKYQKIELLPIIEDNNSVTKFTLYNEYSEDELRIILEQRVKNALLNGYSYVDITDLGLSKDKITFISFLRYYFPFTSYGVEINSIGSNGTLLTKIYISNTMSLKKTKEFFYEMDNKVNDILSLVNDNMSDEIKTLIIHDYFVSHFEYQLTDLDDDSFRSGGILYEGKGVCQAYAYAYQYIMNHLGIECYVTSSDEMNHAWNIINIDGSYYHVDCTWDDPVYDSFGLSRHTYFLLSDDNIKNKKDDSHYGWDLTYLVCNNTKYDEYFWKNVSSPIIINNNNAYYIEENNLNKMDIKTGRIVSLKALDVWHGWNESWWYVGAYSGLFTYNDYLYYNTSTEIRRISYDGTKDELVYKADTSNGYIYGCRLNNGNIEYVLKKSPNESENKILIVPIDLGVESIILPQELELFVGKSQSLDYKVIPANSNSQLVWQSSDENIVKVDNQGNVTAINVGTANIIVRSTNGKQAMCTIHVIEKNMNLGDVNNDSTVDFLDAIMVLRYDAELIELHSDQLKAADMNGDSEIDFLDAIMILRYDAELIEGF